MSQWPSEMSNPVRVSVVYFGLKILWATRQLYRIMEQKRYCMYCMVLLCCCMQALCSGGYTHCCCRCWYSLALQKRATIHIHSSVCGHLTWGYVPFQPLYIYVYIWPMSALRPPPPCLRPPPTGGCGVPRLTSSGPRDTKETRNGSVWSHI